MKKSNSKKAATAERNDEPAPAPSSQAQEPAPVALRRVSVRISADDLAAMQEHFAAGKSGNPLVAVHPPAARKDMSPAQREWRKAYRQRPEVRERNKAYRAERRKRLRAAATAQVSPTI